MRNRRIGRSFVLTTLACAVLVAGVSLTVSGALASGERRTAPADKISDCLRQLNKDKAALREAEDYLKRKGENAVVYIAGAAGTASALVSVRQVIDFLTLEYIAGQTTTAEYRRALLHPRSLLAKTRARLRLIRNSLRGIVNEQQKACDALKGQAQPKPKPPPPSGSLPLTTTEVSPPHKLSQGQTSIGEWNKVQWEINPAAGEAIWDHCCEAGKWKTKFKIVVPDSLSPGRSSTIKLTIEALEKCDSGSGCGFSIGVNAEGIQGSNQLVASAKSGERAFEEKTLTLAVPATAKDAKDLFITVIIGNGPTLTYTYHRAGA